MFKYCIYLVLLYIFLIYNVFQPLKPELYIPMFVNAHKFLQNTTDYLRNQTARNGYDTCHRIKNYDATKCAEDCRELEKSKFAKECRSKKGLFKCCIRCLFIHLLLYSWVYRCLKFSDVIRNLVMNADFVVHFQFVQLETNISSKTQRRLQMKLKMKNLKKLRPKLCF